MLCSVSMDYRYTALYLYKGHSVIWYVMVLLSVLLYGNQYHFTEDDKIILLIKNIDFCLMNRSVIFTSHNKIDAWLKTNKQNNQAFNKKLKNKVKYLLIILVLIIGTSISIKQYKNTYPDPSDRKDLSVKGIFLD